MKLVKIKKSITDTVKKSYNNDSEPEVTVQEETEVLKTTGNCTVWLHESSDGTREPGTQATFILYCNGLLKRLGLSEEEWSTVGTNLKELAAETAVSKKSGGVEARRTAGFADAATTDKSVVSDMSVPLNSDELTASFVVGELRKRSGDLSGRRSGTAEATDQQLGELLALAQVRSLVLQEAEPPHKVLCPLHKSSTSFGSGGPGLLSTLEPVLE